jgi:hypothetical protein
MSVHSCACFPPATETDTFSVPQATIFHISLPFQSNNATNPSIPAVTPQPFNGNTNTVYPFTFTSTDPDNDQIAYEVDWNNDSLPDEGTPFVSSGTSQSLEAMRLAQWPTAGTYSFKVRAKDNQGGVSSWTTPSVTLTTIVNGVCGLASGLSFDTLNMLSPGLCASGTQTNFLPTATGWTWGCNGSGGGTSTLLNACTATMKTYTLTGQSTCLNLWFPSGDCFLAPIIDTTPTAMSIGVHHTKKHCICSVRKLPVRITAKRGLSSYASDWTGCTILSPALTVLGKPMHRIETCHRYDIITTPEDARVSADRITIRSHVETARMRDHRCSVWRSNAGFTLSEWRYVLLEL